MDLLQTTLCYLEKDGAYLMLHRVKKKNDVNHDKWVGVGGKFEPGEDALACVMREVREETGLTMHAPEYRGIVDFYCEPWPAERMHLYTCTDFSGTMTECDEGCLEWVDKAAVQALPIWQGDKIFFRLLAENAPFFHLELTYAGDVLQRAVLDGRELPLYRLLPRAPPSGRSRAPPLLRNDFGLCVGRGDLTPPKARHNMPFPVRIRRGGIYAARIPPANALFPPQPKKHAGGC